MSFPLREHAVLAVVSNCCPPLSGSFLGLTHPSATRQQKEQALLLLPFDLHVLGLPPAFNLSHDQTLHLKNRLKCSLRCLATCVAMLANLKVLSQEPTQIVRIRIFKELQSAVALFCCAAQCVAAGTYFKDFSPRVNNFFKNFWKKLCAEFHNTQTNLTKTWFISRFC